MNSPKQWSRVAIVTLTLSATCRALLGGTPSWVSADWQYVEATAHRAAVVRVKVLDRYKGFGLASGVLVRYDGRTWVLTANHVVQTAKSIEISLTDRLTPRRKQKVLAAHVVANDVVWDVAVLGIGSLDLDEAAQLPYGKDSKPVVGATLEACGYGPDGRLAHHMGHFLGYRAPVDENAVTDWLAISGRSRDGDSGGPVFDNKGRVMAVLWGTDLDAMLGAQAGRLHVLLQTAVATKPDRK